MNKKAYLMPDMKVLLLRQRTSILAGSGINKKLQTEEEADKAW